jgi:hypothetical protein
MESLSKDCEAISTNLISFDNRLITATKTLEEISLLNKRDFCIHLAFKAVDPCMAQLKTILGTSQIPAARDCTNQAGAQMLLVGIFSVHT